MTIVITYPNHPDGSKEVELKIGPTKTARSIVQEGGLLPLLEWLFRQLNREDGTELISLIGLDVPSLSVGDTVDFYEDFSHQGEDLHLATYRCAIVGWKLTHENDKAV